MTTPKLAFWILLALLAAAPAHGQRIADLAPAAAGASHAPPALGAERGGLPPGFTAARPGSALRSTVTGALLGAAVGTLAFLAQANVEDCTSTGSMCGLALPLFAGGGAVVGGVVGFVIGSRGK